MEHQKIRGIQTKLKGLQMEAKKIANELTPDEALVLFELLAKFEESDAMRFEARRNIGCLGCFYYLHE